MIPSFRFTHLYQATTHLPRLVESTSLPMLSFASFQALLKNPVTFRL